MGRTREQSDTDAWLERLDPGQADARDASHFREVIAARARVQDAEDALRDAVQAAHAAGDSWTVIGAALGVSRQAAWERFGRVPD